MGEGSQIWILSLTLWEWRQDWHGFNNLCIVACSWHFSWIEYNSMQPKIIWVSLSLAPSLFHKLGISTTPLFSWQPVSTSDLRKATVLQRWKYVESGTKDKIAHIEGPLIAQCIWEMLDNDVGNYISTKGKCLDLILSDTTALSGTYRRHLDGTARKILLFHWFIRSFLLNVLVLGLKEGSEGTGQQMKLYTVRAGNKAWWALACWSTVKKKQQQQKDCYNCHSLLGVFVSENTDDIWLTLR